MQSIDQILSPNPLITAFQKSQQDEKERRELAATAKLEIINEALFEYWANFNKIKIFRETYCQELPELLRILGNGDNFTIFTNETWKMPFLRLIKSLADLSELFKNDIRPPEPLRQAWMEAICLTENFTKVKSAPFPKDRQEEILNQMSALTTNIQALTQFAKKPYDESCKINLMTATEETIAAYDGYYRIHENRALFRFLGAVTLMLCIAACAISSILIPQVASLVPIMTFITTGLMGIGCISLLVATTKSLTQNQDDAFLFRAKVKEYCFFSPKPDSRPQAESKEQEQPNLSPTNS